MRRVLRTAAACLLGLMPLIRVVPSSAQPPDVSVRAACTGVDHSPPYEDPNTGEPIDAFSIIALGATVDGAPVGASVLIRFLTPDGQTLVIRSAVDEDGRVAGAGGIFTFGTYVVRGPIVIGFTDPNTGEKHRVRIDPTTVVPGGAFEVGPQEVECDVRDLPPGTVLVFTVSPSPVTGSPSPVTGTVSPVQPPVSTEGGGVSLIWILVIGAGVVVVIVGVGVVIISGRREGLDILHPGYGGDILHPGLPGYEEDVGPPPTVVEVEDVGVPPVVPPGTEGTTTTQGAWDVNTTTTVGTTEDCGYLRDRCEELRAAAEEAARRAAEARAKADAARARCEEARTAEEAARRKLERAERDLERPPQGSWMESEGRRITSEDLGLENEEAREAWGAYRRGEITAQELEDVWRRSGDWEHLQELRRKDKERRRKRVKETRDKLDEAHQRARAACDEADALDEGADRAEEAAAEARQAADEACRAADECEERQVERAVQPFGPRVGEPSGPSGPGPTLTPGATTGPPPIPPQTQPSTPPETPPDEPPVRPPVTPPGQPPFVPPTAGGDIAGGPQREQVTPTVVDGRTERDNRPCRCGPDVTGIYLEALNRLIARLRKDVGTLITWAPGSGIAFLAANGIKMDFKVEKVVGPKGSECASCQRCLNTVTLLGRCVVDHTLNDLIFGICAGYFGVAPLIQDLGGHAAELASYGSLDSPISQAIYRVGNEIGRRAYDDENLVVDRALLGQVLKVAPIRIDCDPCPNEATTPWADFSSEDWSWPGSQVPGEPEKK